MGKLLRSQRSANNARPARKHYYHHSVRDFKLDCIQDSKGPTVNVRAPYLSVFNSMSSLFLLKPVTDIKNIMVFFFSISESTQTPVTHGIYVF